MLCNKAILYWIENNFTYFFPRYNLFPEVGVEGRKIPGTNTRVKYFTPDDQAEYTKIPYRGILEKDGEKRERWIDSI
ncbi:UNVERIFIED_CONTAM: hypothetical protein LBW93_04355 [Wolbachia endosymbiont of Nasonia longicornis]